MSEFNLSLRLGNDAMQTPEDVANVLRRVATLLDLLRSEAEAPGPASIRDVNGNTVGEWQFA